MTSSYVAFNPDMLHSPLSFRNSSQMAGISRVCTGSSNNPDTFFPVHSLSAADAAHADFPHFTLKSVEVWPNLPVMAGASRVVNRPKVRPILTQGSKRGLKVRTRGPQPSILVRTLSQFTTRAHHRNRNIKREVKLQRVLTFLRPLPLQPLVQIAAQNKIGFPRSAG